MQDKQTLIKSMTNLINHIAVSQKNQQEIFNSLSRKDFQKIISNLDDPLLRLRNKTAHLIGELLYKNDKLKFKFCQILGISYNSHDRMPAKIMINSNMGILVKKYPNRIPQIMQLLKNVKNCHTQNGIIQSRNIRSASGSYNGYNGQQRFCERQNNNQYRNYQNNSQNNVQQHYLNKSLLWYIDLSERYSDISFRVQHITKNNISDFFYNAGNNQDNNSTSTLATNIQEIDPINSLIGFYLPPTQTVQSQKHPMSISATIQQSSIKHNRKNSQKQNSISISGIRNKYKNNMSVSAQLPSDHNNSIDFAQFKQHETKIPMKQSIQIQMNDMKKQNRPVKANSYLQQNNQGVSSGYRIPNTHQKPRISLNSNYLNKSYGPKHNTSFTQARTYENNNYAGTKTTRHQERNQIVKNNQQDMFLKLNNPITYKPISLGLRGCETTRQNRGIDYPNAKYIASRQF